MGKKEERAQEKRIKALLEKIEWFVEERRESKGGWAEITDGDFRALDDIIAALVEIKCGPHPDGGYPVEWMVVNRRRFERMHFLPIPHDRDFVNSEIDGELVGENAERIMEIAELNLSIAHGTFQTAFKMWKHYRRKREEKAFWAIIAEAMYEKLDRPLTPEDVKEENLPKLTEEDKRMLDGIDIEALIRRANREFKAKKKG